MRIAVLIASLLAFAFAHAQPIRIGSTLSLTGPLGAASGAKLIAP